MKAVRDKALDILKKLHSGLVDRISEMVVENEEELLSEDQQGFSVGDTEKVYDLGNRLRDVNILLAGLEHAAQLQAQQQAEADPGRVQVAEAAQPFVIVASVQQLSIHTFLSCMEHREIGKAVHVLAQLFGLSLERATYCTNFFMQRCSVNPRTWDIVEKLPTVLSTSFNDTLIVLFQCFGLQGSEAIPVVQTLKSYT